MQSSYLMNGFCWGSFAPQQLFLGMTTDKSKLSVNTKGGQYLALSTSTFGKYLAAETTGKYSSELN
ncbi:MAG: hypothetical protein HC916_19195 [Coleofasciculaceae cyanobacterium SM2_1_6]|nr:hypothetical protein [Coleofasciculaceae cyanobacterium SM2_1_6]